MGSDLSAHLHRSTRQCRERPCTKLILLPFGKTVSGFPGGRRSCGRYRSPILSANVQTCRSGVVSFDRTRVVRLAGVRLSIRLTRLLYYVFGKAFSDQFCAEPGAGCSAFSFRPRMGNVTPGIVFGLGAVLSRPPAKSQAPSPPNHSILE